MHFFSQYRGLRRENYVLFFGRIVTNMGSMVWPMLTMILNQKLGMSAGNIAILTAVFGILMMPATLFGGKLPAPNEETMGPLSAVVLDRYRCDLGIATDGDADRLGIIDDEGHFVHPNQVLVLLYYYLLKYKNWHGPCVRNNSTSPESCVRRRLPSSSVLISRFKTLNIK